MLEQLIDWVLNDCFFFFLVYTITPVFTGLIFHRLRLQVVFELDLCPGMFQNEL